MKDLYKFLSEDGTCATSTPANTIGMGDPVADDGDGQGTDPVPTAKTKKEKVHKKKKHKSEEE